MQQSEFFFVLYCKNVFDSESNLFHEKVDVVVDLKSVEVICVPLESHEETSVRDVGRESSAGRVRTRVVTLDAVNTAVHHVLEAVCS